VNIGEHLMSKEIRDIVTNIVGEACMGGLLGLIAPYTGIAKWFTGIMAGFTIGVIIRLTTSNVNKVINKIIIGIFVGLSVGMIVGWGIDALFEVFLKILVDAFGGIVVGSLSGIIISLIYQVIIHKFPPNSKIKQVNQIGSGVFFGSYLGWSSAVIFGIANIIVYGTVFGAFVGVVIGMIISLMTELIKSKKKN
jgi:hypothetical protein